MTSYERLCNKIFKLDRRIRYASVLDGYGRMMAGGMRRGVRSLEPKSEELRLMAHILASSGLRDTWDQYFGKTLFTVIRREYVNLATFPLKENLVVVTTEPDFPLNQFPQIRDLIFQEMAQILR